MITSILPLPNFQNNLACYTEAQTGEDGQWLTIDIVLSAGRNLCNIARYKKYKLIVEAGGQQYTVIALAMWSEPDMWIYPVYVSDRHGNTYLNIVAINDFFSYTNCVCSPPGSERVTSTVSFVSQACNSSGAPPLDLRYIDDSLSPIARPNMLVEMLECISCLSYGQLIEGYRNTYGIIKKSIPPELGLVLKARRYSEIQSMYNPYAERLSPMADIIKRSMPLWEDIYTDLQYRHAIFEQSTDNILPATPDTQTLLGRMLTCLYAIPSEDFWFDIRTDERDVSDLYYRRINHLDAFSGDFQRMDNWSMLISTLVDACNLNARFPNQQLCAHRTIMEDLCIYDKEKQTMLLYIDLVWCVLAGASGLVNSGNLAGF